MENTKLAALLQTFQPKDWKNFRMFLASPYFNTSDEICRLAEILSKGKSTSRESIFEKIFPGQPHDDQQLNYLVSNTLQLAQDFLGIEKMRATPFQTDYFSLVALSERRLEKHYRFLFDKTFSRLLDEPFRDAQHHFLEYKFQDLERENFDRQGQRRLHESAELAAARLDFFYLTEKLKYTCSMLNSQHFLAQPYQIGFLEEIKRLAAGQETPIEAPGIGIYLHVFKMLTEADATPDFVVLKKMLSTHETRFAREELAVLYQYAINYCILQIQLSKTEFWKEALNLYLAALETGILLQNGWLSPWHFKNIIRLSLNLRRFDFTEKFIQEKTRLLEPNFRSDALHYNLADLFFNTKKYDVALEHLMKVEFSDVYYNLGAKVMLAKIYHETGTDDALESLLHAFKNYLRRNKIISDEVRATYQNFIQILQELHRSMPGKRPALREKIETMHTLTEKNWLLAQV